MPSKEASLKRTLPPVLLALAIAGMGAAYAGPTAQGKGTVSIENQGAGQETPPDCKKNPEDPRCKEKK
ncbi:hypothetical protein [Pelomicrobium sp. G1]|uniref:hypothetical protein n=1 Tax=unclassified Pelomicrobium TaxID=2815318 RepID=UPI0021DDB7DF|nr:MAG: hypothetical protein KatS3mg123_2865 [Burkholderiales bacterium]